MPVPWHKTISFHRRYTSVFPLTRKRIFQEYEQNDSEYEQETLLSQITDQHKATRGRVEER